MVRKLLVTLKALKNVVFRVETLHSTVDYRLEIWVCSKLDCAIIF